MPQHLLHQALAFNPQDRHRYHVDPALLWDLKQGPEYSRLATAPDRYISKRIRSQYATQPPVPVFRVTCGIFPHNGWEIEVRNPLGVTVEDVLIELYRGLRHRISNKEWEQTPRQHQARVAEAFYERTRHSRDPTYEHSQGVRRIDWLLRSTAFVGLTPSVEYPYTWTLTIKRVGK